MPIRNKRVSFGNQQIDYGEVLFASIFQLDGSVLASSFKNAQGEWNIEKLKHFSLSLKSNLNKATPKVSASVTKNNVAISTHFMKYKYF
jgi:hypothetical protein